MTSLVFGNFYFDYYSYRFGLGLELGLRLVLWVRFFSLNYEMSARTERAPSLFLFFFWRPTENSEKYSYHQLNDLFFYLKYSYCRKRLNVLASSERNFVHPNTTLYLRHCTKW